jgi:hypothetical protein
MSNLLYELLPGIYRELDEQGTGALQALLQVIEDIRLDLEHQTAILYDNWFAETCDAATLPKIAALVGASQHLARRGAVANAIASRRRKATFAALERAIFDASGWVVSAKLRGAALPDATGSDAPLEVSISAWRQPVFPITGGTPYRLGGGFYTLHPMGIGVPLFHAPEPNYDIEQPSTPANLPFQIELDTPAQLVDGLSILRMSDGRTNILTHRLADLSNASRPYTAPADPQVDAIIDPCKGIFFLLHEPDPLASGITDPKALAVSYACAFTSGVGGTSIAHPTGMDISVPWLAYVHHAAARDGRPSWLFSTIQEALDAFSRGSLSGTIRILDSATYNLGDYTLQSPGCSQPPGSRNHLTLEATPGEVPCLAGSLRVAPPPPGMNLCLTNLWLDGPIYAGGDLTLTVRHCTIRPQQGPPAEPATISRSETSSPLGIHALPGPQPYLSITLESSICGPIRLPPDCPELTASDSILESLAAPSGAHQTSDSPGPACHLIRTSVLGTLNSTRLVQEDSIVPPYIQVPGGSEVPSNAAPFSDATYPMPNYARLRSDAQAFYLDGASNGSQRGAFNSAEEPRRNQQFNAALSDFMPADIKYTVVWKS